MEPGTHAPCRPCPSSQSKSSCPWMSFPMSSGHGENPSLPHWHEMKGAGGTIFKDQELGKGGQNYLPTVPPSVACVLIWGQRLSLYAFLTF